MEKKNFISLVLGAIGVVLFALGMCMCLIPDWDAATQGVVVGVIGAVVLLVMVIVRRKMSGKPAVQLNGKVIGKVVYAVFAALVLGVGMCMCMVFDMMIPGIIVGLVGIVLLLFLIPMCKGLK